MSTTPQSAVVLSGLGLICNLFRLAHDLIMSASHREQKVWLSGPDGGTGHDAPSEQRQRGGPDRDNDDACGNCTLEAALSLAKRCLPQRARGDASQNTVEEEVLLAPKDTYGSAASVVSDGPTASLTLDDTPVAAAGEEDVFGAACTREDLTRRYLPLASHVFHAVLLTYFVATLLSPHRRQDDDNTAVIYLFDALTILIGLVTSLRDKHREWLTLFPRVLYILAPIFLLLRYTVLPPQSRPDAVALTLLLAYLFLAVSEVALTRRPIRITQSLNKKPLLSSGAVLLLLKPYFWPDATATSALLNRVRAILTWFCVAASKACNLVAPILIGRALTALSVRDYRSCVLYGFGYVTVQFLGSFFKECQGLVYLKVAQAAFVQLSGAVFRHIHELSLDWHLRKKLGEVLRSMDRGIQACDTLMKYLFLWLVPAITEMILVCVLFMSYFNYLPLAAAVFLFVFVYMVMTIVLTLWRKKFRKAVAKSDNDWHDRCTDSLINFETVKYFTAEKYEMDRFGTAVKAYQTGSVNVQASLSLLNILQRVLSQACLGTALALTAFSIKQRFDCCLASTSCSEDDIMTCCADVPQSTCPGMQIGDFVAVMSYTVTLFQPLNFLGSVYNAIVMAIIDLNSMSELLAENPDVTDDPNAIALPAANTTDDPDTVVEFCNVRFHYPTQPPTSGLKNISFKMKKGSITALVGQTGSGKSTMSRLLFRFYDVLDGCIKVNGVDVRNVTQKSLRESIGVVPQAASLFNDTLRSNILYGKRDATADDLDEVARDAQLTNFISNIADGWETLVGDRGLKLSGGEKQRVAIARCLLKNPPIVILDEATSALDTVTEKSVQEALDRLGNDRTCLVIAHRLGTIRNADKIIVLGEGSVLEEGTHDELLEKDGVYANMWNMQLHERVDSKGNLREFGSSDSLTALANKASF
eukprot:CAMPEP_0172480666 /NCGR_PEP_ID=MMETSP1066-20121228/5989_1 /TAXON_ID=671091 /ORGANISM="Coscinodiscus wailesii, Strain CCMP2513" /LENGTH=926 /DNA_ID=CAMNT_0013242199 /DNA_START=98 /DNA_END=2878 /DNA_ORIENTATION=-